MGDVIMFLVLLGLLSMILIIFVCARIVKKLVNLGVNYKVFISSISAIIIINVFMLIGMGDDILTIDINSFLMSDLVYMALIVVFNYFYMKHSNGIVSKYDELEKLHKLFIDNAITKEEYETEKRKILNK